MIHVGFGTSNLYAKLAGTMMLSLFENHISAQLPSITVHILHDGTFTNANREKFSRLAEQYGQAVKFYNVDELCQNAITAFKRLIPSIVNDVRWTRVTLYRLLPPQLLSTEIEKFIYLDADIIVNLDIKDLWQIELDDKPVAAVPEEQNDPLDHPKNAAQNYLVTSTLVDYNDYFNAGVLLMNLNYFRNNEETLLNGIKFLGEHPELKYFDQEILNYLFSKVSLKLPVKFNTFVRGERFLEKNPQIQRKIYHYVNSPGNQGLGMDINDNLNLLWMNYFIKTPWFDAQTIGHLYEVIQLLHVNLKKLMIQISTMMSGKTRAFFTAPNSVNAIKKIFSVRDDEEIIPTESESSLEDLLNAMKKSRGKKVFFIMLPNFPFQELTDAGFEDGEDFINGIVFLSAAQGIPMRSFPLIQMM